MLGRRILATIAVAAAIPLAASGKGAISGEVQGVAIGAFLGQPTGLSCRLGLGGPSSIEAKAAWDLAGSKDKAASFSFQANYLVEFPGLLEIEGRDIPPYLGGGVQFDIGSETVLGIRAPLGLVYRLPSAPVEFCVEIGLGMGLIPSTTPLFSGGIGVRYVLGKGPGKRG